MAAAADRDTDDAVGDSLRSPYFQIREAARDRAGSAAIDGERLAEARRLLGSEDHRVRAAAVSILARALRLARSPGTQRASGAAAPGGAASAGADTAAATPPDELVALLVRALLSEVDRATLRDMAHSVAPVGRTLLDAVSSDSSAGSASANRLRAALLRAIVRFDLEARLADITTIRGSIKGFFRDPFDGLLELGTEALPVLLEIAGNPALSESLRGLAVRAVGEFGDPSAIAALRRIHDDRKIIVEAMEAEDPKSIDLDGHLYRACRYILYRLGDTDPFRDRINVLRRRAEKSLMDRGRWYFYFDYQWEIAYEWHQVKEYDVAVRRYKNLLFQIERHAVGIALSSIERISYYNLACIHSILGELDEAFDYLNSAIERGFRDLEWILLDRDLELLRTDPRFEQVRELLADELPTGDGRRDKKK